MKKTLIVLGLVAILLLVMTAVAGATTDPTGLPWTDADLTATSTIPHAAYMVAGSAGCLKCHAYAAGYSPVPDGDRGSIMSVTQPVIPGSATTGYGSFRGLRGTNANDLCDYCHVTGQTYTQHRFEFMNPAVSYIPAGSQGIQKNPKSGHRVGGTSGLGWTPFGNRATPMSTKTLSSRQMYYLGPGGKPTGPPTSGALVCTSCHSVHATDVQALQTAGIAMITRFTDADDQLLREDPAQDGIGVITVWPGPPARTISVPVAGSEKWYTYFCADCHNAAHANTQAGDTVAHRWTERPYVGVDTAVGTDVKSTSIGEAAGTKIDGYIDDADTWNAYDNAPTCRQCHSVRAYRPSSTAQGGDPRRPRFPHLGVTSDQLLRDNTIGELSLLSPTVLGARFAGINNLTAMSSATWPPTFYDAGMGEEMIVNANAVCLSCHDSTMLP